MVMKKAGRPAGTFTTKSKVDKLFLGVVNHFSSQTEAADALDCSQSHIWTYLSKTKKQSISPILAMRAEAATAGAFNCEDLCPELTELFAVIAENRNNKNLAALGAATTKED